MSKKCILILAQEYEPFRGGIATYATRISQAVAQLGFAVHVVAPRHGTGKSESTGSLHVHRFPGRHYRAWQFLFYCARYVYAIWRFKPHVIHAVDLPSLYPLVPISPAIRAKVLLTIHGTELLLAPRGVHLRVLSPRRVLRAVDKILTNSRFTERLLHKTLAVPACTEVIPTYLGVDAFWFQVDERRPSFMEKLRSDAVLICTVARMHPRKGQDLVVEALGKLSHSDRSRIQYIAAGDNSDPDYSDRVLRAARNADVDFLHLTGLSNTDIRKLYRLSLLHAMPGRIAEDAVEGFGLSFMEAAAQGTPSIGAKIGGVPEVIVHGRTGFLIEPEDVASLAELLGHALQNQKEMKDLGTQAKAHARTFTWRKCAELTYGNVLF